jgi:hypothetical protein
MIYFELTITWHKEAVFPDHQRETSIAKFKKLIGNKWINSLFPQLHLRKIKVHLGHVLNDARDAY